MTSKRPSADAIALLSSARCWTRVTLSRAVPSFSVSLASIATCGLNSLGMMKSGVWSNPAIFYAR